MQGGDSSSAQRLLLLARHRVLVVELEQLPVLLARNNVLERYSARVQRQPTTLLGVLEVPAALDVLAAVVRVLRAARSKNLLAGLVVRLAALLVG